MATDNNIVDNFINRYTTKGFTGVGSGVYAPGTVVDKGGSVVGRTSGGGVRQQKSSEDVFEALLAEFDRKSRALTQRPQAANIDIAGINQRALKKATRAQNPMFRTEANLIKKDITNRRKQFTEEAQRQREEVQTLLKEFIEDSRLNKQRTEEDVAQNLEEVGFQEELFQETEAQTADQERTQTADELAAAGLTTSGLGRQQAGQQQQQRNRESGTKQRAIDQERAAQIEFKSRTFEDLQRGEVRKEAATARERKAIKQITARRLDNLAIEQTLRLRSNEVQRKQAIAREQGNQASQEFAKILTTLGSGQAEATARAYGGFF